MMQKKQGAGAMCWRNDEHLIKNNNILNCIYRVIMNHHHHHTPEFQTFLKAIAREWNRLVPKGTAVVINSVSDRSDFIKNIYLHTREHADRPINYYPHIHIFLERHNYMFTVSCANDKHSMNKMLSSSSFSTTQYCAHFQQLLKPRCNRNYASAYHRCNHYCVIMVIMIFGCLMITPHKRRRIMIVILFIFVLSAALGNSYYNIISISI